MNASTCVRYEDEWRHRYFPLGRLWERHLWEAQYYLKQLHAFGRSQDLGWGKAAFRGATPEKCRIRQDDDIERMPREFCVVLVPMARRQFRSVRVPLVAISIYSHPFPPLIEA